MNIYKKVAFNIKHYRKLRKISQEELAELTGYTPEYIRRIESPSYSKGFTIEAVYQISIALEIDIKLLFEEPKNSSSK